MSTPPAPIVNAPATTLLSNAKLFELSPLHVDEGQRIGFLHEDKAAALGRLMAVDGQRDPIKVVAQPQNADQPWRLVTGMHRLIGARLEAITVWAIEVSGTAEDLADLEASENLHRRPLAPIERAKFVHALCEAAMLRIARQNGDLKQQKYAIQQRWARVKAGELRSEQALQDEAGDTLGHLELAYGWQESVADALGLGLATIKRSQRLYRMLIEPFPDLIEALSRHPIVGENDKQLRDLADVRSEAERRRMIEALIADPELSADAVRVMFGLDAPGNSASVLPHQKFVNAVMGNMARLTATLQKRHLPELISSLKSDEVKRELRDRLNAELGE